MTEHHHPSPVGWNTWDVQHHTGVAHLPTGLRVRFGLIGPDGTVADGFTWRHGLERLGDHAVDGSYAEVTVTALDTSLNLQFVGGPSDELAVEVVATGAADVLMIVDRMPGTAAELKITPHATGVELLVDGSPWTLSLSAPPVVLEQSANALRVRIPASGSATAVYVAPAGSPTPATGERVRAARQRAASDRLRTSGWLDTAGDAYVRSVTWNTIYAPDIDSVLTPTSRDFVCAEREGFYGRWAVHAWDTFFTGLIAGWVDTSYAQGIFRQILDQADARGMLPNRVSDERGRTDDRSQSPVGGVTVLKAYLGSGLGTATRDQSLLTDNYDDLRRWHKWWLSARRGPFGLLAWGSDPVEGDPDSDNLEILIDRTKREGLDDSPMYDEVTWDPSTHTQNLADVGLNGLHVADARAVAAIAELLGHDSVARDLRGQATAAAEEVNRLLWAPENGEYRNRWAEGAFSEHVAPTMLYPLLGGVPSREYARSLVDHLLRPDVLGGDPPLPSVARNDPGFNTRYWRGRVWAPMVYLAVEGLRQYSFDDEARTIVRSLLRLFLHEWNAYSHVRENYPIEPGEDVRPLAKRSDGLMSWGSLLAYLAFTELADPRPDGWRFAHPGEPAELADVPLGDGRLTVTAGDDLVVRVDGQLVLRADAHVVVTEYRREPDEVSGVATAQGSAGHVSIAGPRGGRTRELDLPIPGQPVPFEIGASRS